ncbi:MAG: M56 family metallopeptidase [Victivallaceae bacterium]|nr:M56 family metallopeptidase [Victivallaceae bacterium]
MNSQLLLMYLGGTLFRGGLLCLGLVAFELFFRRRILFAGAGKFYVALFMLTILPLGVKEYSLARQTNPTAVTEPAVTAGDPPLKAAAFNAAAPVEMATVTVAAEPAPAVAAPAAAKRTFDWAKWTLISYGLIALWLSAKRLRRFFVWRGRVRRCVAITGGRVFDIFLKAKRDSGLEHKKIELRSGGELLDTPASFNALPGKVLLCPLKEMDGLSDAELEMLMIHELGHFRRSDNPASLFMALTADVLWINVFLRLLLARFALICELDCDALVRCKAGAKNATYAKLLLRFQRRVSRIPAAGLGATAQNLKLRIEEFTMNNGLTHKHVVLGVMTAIGAGMSLFSPALAIGDTGKAVAAAAVLPEPAAPFPAELAKYVPEDIQFLGRFSRSGYFECLKPLAMDDGATATALLNNPSISELFIAGKIGPNPNSAMVIVRSAQPLLSANGFEPLGGEFYRYMPRTIGSVENGAIPAWCLETFKRLPAGATDYAIAIDSVAPMIFALVPEADGFRGTLIGNGSAESRILAQIRARTDVGSATVIDNNLQQTTWLIPKAKTEAELVIGSYLNRIYPMWSFKDMRDRKLAAMLIKAPDTSNFIIKFSEECREKLLSGQYSPEINGYPKFLDGWGAVGAGRRALAGKLLMGDYRFITTLDGRPDAAAELFEQLDRERPEMAVYSFVVVRDDLVRLGKMELAAKYCPDPAAEFAKIEVPVIPFIKTRSVEQWRPQAQLMMESGEALLKIADYEHNAEARAKIEAGMKAVDKLIVERENAPMATPPRVVSTIPANGATDVSPDTTEITVNFDIPMSPGGYSFCQRSPDDFPETTGERPTYTSGTSIVMPVKLRPGTRYNIWLNGANYTGFRSADGNALDTYYYTFTTADK